MRTSATDGGDAGETRIGGGSGLWGTDALLSLPLLPAVVEQAEPILAASKFDQKGEGQARQPGEILKASPASTMSSEKGERQQSRRVESLPSAAQQARCAVRRLARLRVFWLVLLDDLIYTFILSVQ